MPKSICHACGAPPESGSENIRGNVYCPACLFDMFQECEQCSEETLNEELYYCDGSAFCATCAADLGFQRCEHCECWEQSSAIIDAGSDGHICSVCAEELGYQLCDNCRGVIREGDRRREWTDHNARRGEPGRTYCGTCTDELLTRCEDCGRWNLTTDMQSSDGGNYCDRCDSMPDFSRDEEITGQTFDEIGSQIYFGVELETHRCRRYMRMEDNPYWGAKCDPTVRGKEFDSAKMNGDEGLNAVRELCALADEHSWVADYRCGYHLHIDMSTYNARQLRAIAYAYGRTAVIWESLVSEERTTNGWCDFASLEDNCIKSLTTKNDWTRLAYDTERYRWLNWQAYQQHGTLELRFHEGTVDCDQIVNWVKAHVSFIDWATKVGCNKVKQVLGGNPGRQFASLCDIWKEAGHTELCDFYFEKCNRQDVPQPDTGVLV